ncbi:MAG: hypothetical protein ACPGVX_04610, partial [Thalassobaculaceae bacterium]
MTGTDEKRRLRGLVFDAPVELPAPDIAAYAAGNTGIPYYWSFEAAAPGPHVAILALTHGNEICGALTLDAFFRADLRPTRGRLTLGFNNVAAYAQFDPRYPIASRFVDEDLNRVWSLDRLEGAENSLELTRAREIRPFIDTVDLLLDLHSMQTPSPPLMLAGPLEKGRQLAQAIGAPRHIMCDQGHAAGKRLRDYGGFGDPAAPQNAVLLEAGQHWAAATENVSTDTAVHFLRACDLIDDATFDHFGPALVPAAQDIIAIEQAVTVEHDDFQFHRRYQGLEVIAAAGTEIATDGGRPVVTPFDNCVLVMPNQRLWPGQTAVRL